MTALGLIPARSGSSEVVGKNVRPLAGRPLIYYTISAACQSRLDRVIMSTDSEDYRELGRQYGVEAPFLRPTELATNEAPALSVVQHSLDWLEREDGWLPDAVIYLQPTSPLRQTSQIDTALSLISEDVDSVISVRLAKDHPYFMFVQDEDGQMVEYVKVDKKPERRQDLPPIWSLDDNIMLSKTAYLRNANPDKDFVVSLDNFRPLFLNDDIWVDINSEQDFLFAEFLMQRTSTS